MITTAIIAEFNPLHKGHEYLINKARELTNADCIIVIMSGYYTQRGDIALTSKWSRCKCALLCGADLVIELPYVYATSSAETFALGAISSLNSLNCVDYVVFGSESSDINVLNNTATLLANEPLDFKAELNNNLKKGYSFPTARQLAYEKIVNDNSEYLSSDELKASNNILAIEYIKAIINTHSSIIPLTIKRSGHAYNDLSITKDEFISASALRNVLKNNINANNILNSHVPACTLEEYSEDVFYPLFNDDYMPYIGYSLINNTISLDEYADMTTFISNKINNLYKNKGISFMGCSFEELVLSLKTKDITATRISRALNHMLIGLYANDAEAAIEYAKNGLNHVRILGITDNGKSFLKKIKKATDCVLINSLGKSYNKLNEASRMIIDYDIKAANIYCLIYSNKYSMIIPDDYRHGIIQV